MITTSSGSLAGEASPTSGRDLPTCRTGHRDRISHARPRRSSPAIQITCEIDASCDSDVRIRRSNSHNASKSHVNPPCLPHVPPPEPHRQPKYAPDPSSRAERVHRAHVRADRRCHVLLAAPDGRILALLALKVPSPARSRSARSEGDEHEGRGGERRVQRDVGPGTAASGQCGAWKGR